MIRSLRYAVDPAVAIARNRSLYSWIKDVGTSAIYDDTHGYINNKNHLIMSE